MNCVLEKDAEYDASIEWMDQPILLVCFLFSFLQGPAHGQSLEYRRGLEEGEPSVPGRQTDHEDYFHHAQEFPGHHARIGSVLVDETDGAQQKADEIGLYERPLDLPVVDFSRSVDDESLCQNQRTERPVNGASDHVFSVVEDLRAIADPLFHREDQLERRGKDETEDSDENRKHGVNHKERIESPPGRQHIREASSSSVHRDAVVSASLVGVGLAVRVATGKILGVDLIVFHGTAQFSNIMNSIERRDDMIQVGTVNGDWQFLEVSEKRGSSASGQDCVRTNARRRLNGILRFD